MKILFDHSSPFLLAHGGFQIQIEETKRALEALGVSVEFLRWWDDSQGGDIIHFFGRPAGPNVDLAHKKNIRVVMSELLTGLGSRSASAIALQSLVIHGVQKIFPRAFWTKMGWDSYTKADRIIALTPWEAELMQRVFGAPAERMAVIPNGVAEEFLTTVNPSPRADYLVCAATITERKRIVETVLAAVEARTPLWVIGKPYSETEPYARKFFAFAKQHSDLIRYEGPIEDRHQLARAYRQARGFVLLSTQESLSLSALEAAACECPLLLSDLPWARTVFGDSASYCPIAKPVARTARYLREFYDAAPRLKPPLKPPGWPDIARQLKAIYESLVNTSR